MSRLKDKVAVITGGAGDLARATARRFADEGAKLLLVDLDSKALEDARREIDNANVRTFVADVTCAADNHAMIDDAVRQFGGVDIFLANAGIEGAIGPITECDDAAFDRIMAVNVKGPFLGLKAVIPAMRARGGGSIVISSSVAGLRGAASVAPYSASKHAVIGLMKSAAREVATDGIRVNTINPGPIDSRMMGSLEHGLAPGAEDRAKALMTANIPMKRYAQPSDIANLLLFLASDESAFITGAVYLADGGMMA